MAQTTPNTKKSPLARVKSEFGGKKELVEKVKALATGELWASEARDEKAWGSISNAKLLHIHEALTEAKKRFGSREKMIDAILAAENRSKDQDYRKHFADWSVARLFDTINAHEKAQRKVASKAKGAPKAKA